MSSRHVVRERDEADQREIWGRKGRRWGMNDEARGVHAMDHYKAINTKEAK
jgi:hypothetical protein